MLKIVWGGTGILHAISRRFAIIEKFSDTPRPYRGEGS